MKTETREIPIPILLSITTGKLLTEDFSEMHGAAEFVLGSPIFTHHFASSEMFNTLKVLVLAQHPDLKHEDCEDVNPDNWKAKVKGYIQRFGKTRIIEKGDGLGVMHPLEGLPKGKPILTNL